MCGRGCDEAVGERLLESIAADLEAGLIFARLAEAHAAAGRFDEGEKARAHAEQALSKAEQRLRQAASVGWDVSALGHPTRTLRNRLYTAASCCVFNSTNVSCPALSDSC